MNEDIFSVVRVLMDANADTPKRYEHDNDFRKFVEESIEKRPNLKPNNTYQKENYFIILSTLYNLI